MGTIITLTGVSASGKTTLAGNLLMRVPGARMVPSYTTRRPRNSDLSGEYRYVTSEECTLFDSDAMAWSVWKGGNRYGTRSEDIFEPLEGSGTGIMILVPSTVTLLRGIVAERFGDAGLVQSYFLVTPGTQTLYMRMQNRGDALDAITERIEAERDWEAEAKKSDVPYRFLPNDTPAVMLDQVLMSI